MRSVQKFFFFGLLFSLLSFLLVSVGQPDTSLNLENKTHPSLNLQTNLIIDDFLVNDDTGTLDQELPAISVDSSGNFVITWMDYRNGDYYHFNPEIYAQKYNYWGIPMGMNFRVNDDSGHLTQEYPAIAMDRSGNFIITWEDYRERIGITHYPNIYAQRYDSSANKLGSNFRVNNDTGCSAPAVGMDGYGNFVITWLKGGDIYSKRYNSSGIPLGSNFKVNNISSAWTYYPPAITMNSFGNFIIAWYGILDTVWNIYAQRYDATGNPQGSNFKVTDNSGVNSLGHIAIGIDFYDNFTVTWDDTRIGDFDIYAQRYNSSGYPLGSNFKVDNDSGIYSNVWPNIDMNDSGDFVIVWTGNRNSNTDVYAQRYSSNGNPVGSNYLIPNYKYAPFYQETPFVSINNSNLYFTWIDGRRGGRDIYAKVIDWTWTKVEEDQEVSLPNSFDLAQNYPNPFNPTTTIQFRVWSLENPSTPP